jgi:hypothetical protein
MNGQNVLFFNANEIFQSGLLQTNCNNSNHSLILVLRQSGLLQTNCNNSNHSLILVLRQIANNMWHLLDTTKYLNTGVLTCAEGRSTCRMVPNSWIPSMSSEHCGAQHSSTIALTHNLSFSSISTNITSYFSSPPIPCSSFAKCNCKSSLQFFQ